MLTALVLADRTNGCAYATVLRPSIVCLSSVTYVLWLNGASYRKSDEANRKWPMGNRLVTWPMTSRDPERSRSWLNTQYLENSWKCLCYLATIAI